MVIDPDRWEDAWRLSHLDLDAPQDQPRRTVARVVVRAGVVFLTVAAIIAIVLMIAALVILIRYRMGK